MGKLIVTEFVTLDGVAQAPGGAEEDRDGGFAHGGWHMPYFDAISWGWQVGQLSRACGLLLGRRTYDDWAAFWPTSDIEPFASFINAVDKFVATSTPVGDPWSNTTVVDGDFFERVHELKSRSGGDIGVHGSIELAQALLERNLVDELRLVVAPAVQARGRKLFDKGLSGRLTLTRTVASPSGYLLLDYHVRQ